MNKVDVSTDDIISLYESGLSLKDIGDKFNITASAVRKRLLSKNYKLRKRNDSKKILLPMDKIIKLYQEGKSIQDIAKELGFKKSLIGKAIKQLGLSRSPQESKSIKSANYTNWTDELDATVKNHLEASRSLVDTAKYFNLSPNALQFRNKTKWRINLSFWNKETERTTIKLLEKYRDYDIVSKLLGITRFSLESKNRELGVDLSDNSNLFGIPTVANDGNKYRSKIEAQVANYLIENNITFEYEVRVCKDRRWKCDFKIGSLWIELDGLGPYRRLTGDAPYDKLNAKIEHYKSNSMDYLILPKHGWRPILAARLGLLST